MGATNSNGPVPTFTIAKPSFGEATRFWLKLGFISFGGPTGQIAIMHQELVERRRWIGEERFLRALNFCMLLPGPEAQQLATYVGWMLHGIRGGVVAGVLFVLPSAVLLWLLSCVYVMYGNVAWVASLLYGLKPAVIAIVAHAVWRIGRRALKTRFMWAVSLAAFTAIFFFRVQFPVIILSAGLIGLLLERRGWKHLVDGGMAHGAASDSDEASVTNEGAVGAKSSPAGHAARVAAVCLVLWWTPVLLTAVWLGWGHALVREGVFFSKAAMITFGGAYAVLPYVAQQAVERYEWLNAAQMLDGLGLAETTPGPLIMVLQFVGFLGGWNQPGDLPRFLSATLGAAITTWVTFVPCFLWILAGAPYIERLHNSRPLAACLSTITAAVVGVVLNLAVWFAGHVLLPESGRIDVAASVIAVAALVLLCKEIVGIVPIVLGGALVGAAMHLLGGAP